ncbi:MAG TPA: ATP-binding protein, partial [Allocoleopsis sp.]
MSEESSNKNYDAGNIVVLEGLEAVRKRPGMYIGSTSSRGLHHLVYEIVDNSIDEALAGFCTKITVIVGKDNSIVVIDNGRGIPTNIHPKYNISAVEVALTKLHAGGKFDKNTYKVSGGLHGVGLSVVSALSKKLQVTVKRDGKVHTQNYSCGIPQDKLTVIGECDIKDTGTTVHFWPDDSIFTETIYDFQVLENRLRELAFLNKGIRIILQDERIESGERDTEGNIKTKEQEYYYEGGIVSFVEFLNKNKKILHPPIYVTKAKDKIDVEVALQYTDAYNESVYSFVNNINTIEGGTHLVGFKTALTRTLNNYIEKNPSFKEKEKLSSEDVREGLGAIISVKVPEPQFEGQTKTKLGNSDVKGIVDSIVSAALAT